MENKTPSEVSKAAHNIWQKKVEYDARLKKEREAKKNKKEERNRKNEANERDMGLRNEERGADIPGDVSYEPGDKLSRAAAILGKQTRSPRDRDGESSHLLVLFSYYTTDYSLPDIMCISCHTYRRWCFFNSSASTEEASWQAGQTRTSPCKEVRLRSRRQLLKVQVGQR